MLLLCQTDPTRTGRRKHWELLRPTTAAAIAACIAACIVTGGASLPATSCNFCRRFKCDRRQGIFFHGCRGCHTTPLSLHAIHSSRLCLYIRCLTSVSTLELCQELSARFHKRQRLVTSTVS